MAQKKHKAISCFSIKSTTTSGHLCKMIVWVFDDGIVKINRLVLSEENEIDQHVKLYSKFGKNLFVQAFAFKYPTLNSMHRHVTKILKENVEPKDILF